MYGVLYAISPEIFPANHRGTGNGLTGAAARVFGLLVRSFRRQLIPHELTVHISTGTYHCVICKPRYCRTRIHRWRTCHRFR